MKVLRRTLLPLLVGVLAFGALLQLPVAAQTSFPTAALQALKQTLTSAGYFGLPRYTTAALPACTAANLGAVAYDTTTDTTKYCNASAWTAFSGAALGGTNVWTAGNTFTDNLFTIADDGDSSKKAQFQASGISTTTTRTYTLPNASSTLCVASVDCGFTTTQTFNSGNNTGATFNGDEALSLTNTIGQSGVLVTPTAQTPDAPFLATGTLSNSWIVAEYADRTFDFAHAQQFDPTIFAHTHNQSQTEYTAYRAVGTQSELSKTLTESSATAVVQIGIASGSFTGGSIEYTVVASDATDHQSRHGRTIWQGVNKAGTETCTITPTLETTDGSSLAASTGTLTYTWTSDTSPTNACNFALNAVSSLTQTTLRIYYTVVVDGPATVTPQ